MNSLKIQPKTIVLSQVDLEAITITRVDFNPETRYCRVAWNGGEQEFRDDEIDALDFKTPLANILEAIRGKIGAVAAPDEIAIAPSPAEKV